MYELNVVAITDKTLCLGSHKFRVFGTLPNQQQQYTSSLLHFENLQIDSPQASMTDIPSDGADQTWNQYHDAAVESASVHMCFLQVART